MTTHSRRRFRYRIRPHEIMQEEYPQDYYKFKNPQVASAFFLETLGEELKKIPRHFVRFRKPREI